MPLWWVEAYGDPCRSCRFDWSISIDAAILRVSDTPGRYAAIFSDRRGEPRLPQLSWSAKGYVFHVADNLRIWAERLMAASSGATGLIAEYDDELLATARAYEQMPLEGALWSLGRAAECWAESVTIARECEALLNHPARGTPQVGATQRRYMRSGAETPSKSSPLAST